MGIESSEDHQGANGAAAASVSNAPPVPRRRSPWPLAVVAALFIIIPFLFWYGTWFGRPLREAEIEKYLNEEKQPRHTQHALSQLAERITKGDPAAAKWYPRVTRLARESPSVEVRMTAAWVMGQDNRSTEFHETLVRLLEDHEPVVRENAALALVRYGDARARPELRAMLRPHAVLSPVAGQLATFLPPGTIIQRGAMLGRVVAAGRAAEPVFAPLPGKLVRVLKKEGEAVAVGEPLFELAPEEATIWEALRGLYLVGVEEDLPEIERYAAGSDPPERVRKQAALTAAAIRKRSEN